MRVVLIVPGGVDPPGSDRVIPFIHDLVSRLASDHDVEIIAIGHEPEPREWRLFDSRVVNVPIGRHSKSDIARAILRSSRAVSSGPRPDVIHGLWAGVTGLAAATIGRRYSIPSVVSMCGGELAALPQINYGGGLTRGGRALARTALALPTVTTAATEWMVAHTAAAGARIDELVPLGADRLRFRPSTTPRDGTHLVQVASLNGVKDQLLALRAFALVREERPDATFTLAGVDTMNGAHMALAETLGIQDSVRFAGFVQPDALADLYRSATIHLNTSWHDAGPLAVLEAALCGVATVGMRVGHVADFAALPEPAAIAVGHDARDVATGIERLLNDPSLRRSIAQRANAWASAHDADHTAAAFSAIYRRLSARSSRAVAAASGDEPRRKT